LAKRLKGKKDADLAEIIDRMDKVGIERAYRIIKALEDFAKEIKEEKIPTLQEALQDWGKKVFWTDISVFTLILIALGLLHLEFSIFDSILSSPTMAMVSIGLTIALFLGLHLKARAFFARRISKQWAEKDKAISKAIMHNTRWWRSIFGFGGRNWHKSTKGKLDVLMTQGREAIQRLNDQFVSPSGLQDKREKQRVEDETVSY
jgi:hypothetical protein